MKQSHLPLPPGVAADAVLAPIADAPWESPRIVHHSADAMDRGSLRILAGETPIDQKPGDEGDDSDAPY